VLRGKIRHTSPLETLYYVVDYNYGNVYETSVDLGGKRSADFSLPLDVSGWRLGRHTLRLTAKGADGRVTDIAEYTVFVSDGGDGYDPATGTLTVNMSAYADQSGIVSHSNLLNYDGYIWRSSADSLLYLGDIDLSRYKAVRFYYSVRGDFFGDTEPLIGLTSGITHIQSGDDPSTVAAGALPAADLPLTEIQTVTLDLTDCTYRGGLWLSVLRPARKIFYLREIRFYEGEIPADVEETDAMTSEAETELVTSPTTGNGDLTSTPSSGKGCAAVLSPMALPVVFVGFALLSVKGFPFRAGRRRRG
jgi:hypothetical protein